MLKNQKGFSMMEAVIAAGLVGAISVAALTMWENYFKTDLGQKRINELSQDLYVLRSFIEDPKACVINFKGKELGTKLEEFKNSNKVTILKVGSAIGKEAYILENIEIGTFDPKMGRTSINLLLKKTDIKGRSQSTIRRFYILTKVKENVIEECVDPLQTTSDGALVKMCADADPLREWDCTKVLKNMAYDIKKRYCGNHPILRFDENTGKCYALDAAKVCTSGYIRGFDNDGNLNCYLGPGKPPVLPGMCVKWGPWYPDTNTQCEGVPMKQKRHCMDIGFSGTEFLETKGTKKGCEVAP